MRRKASKKDQHGRPDNADGKRELEPLDDARNLLEECDIFRFLGRGAPRHVDAEHVREDGLRDVHGDATEEDRQERDPGEVLQEGGEERFLADAVTKDGESDVSERGEDADDGEEDAEAVDVVVVEVAIEPADDQVVHKSEDPSATDSIICANIRANGEFAR